MTRIWSRVLYSSQGIGNGSVKDIDIGEKTSGTILQELLALDRSAQAKAS